jgi:hypothetical protein
MPPLNIWLLLLLFSEQNNCQGPASFYSYSSQSIKDVFSRKFKILIF